MVPRVVSLVPSATETLIAWGRPPIACTRFCEQPELEHVGGTKDPHIGRIVALRPDVVVMCEEENRLEDAQALAAAGIASIVLRIDSVDDVEDQLTTLASGLEIDVDRTDLFASGGEDGVRTGGGAAGDMAAIGVVVPIWRRPWMVIGPQTYGASLLGHLGIDTVAPTSEDRYPTIDDWTPDGLGVRPDVVLVPSEPYPFAPRHREELEQVAPARYIDGQDLFWWGWRTPLAIARLGTALADLRA